MFRSFLLLLVAMMFAPAAFAQNNDYSHYEFYVGYAYERADNNAATFDRNGKTQFNGNTVQFQDKRENYNGVHAEFTQNITRHVGIVTSLTATYNDDCYTDLRTGRTFGARQQRYDLMIGPRYNFRGEAVTPFVEAMAGVTHMRVNFDDGLTNRRKADTAFAMAFGGGVDVRAGDHIDIRVIQADYVPTFFNSTRQDNIRLGAGVKIK